MDAELTIRLVKEALEVALIISGPLLLAALLVGIGVSILQAVTSIQDLTLSFVPRMTAVFVVLILIFPWMLRVLKSYAVQVFSNLARYVA